MTGSVSGIIPGGGSRGIKYKVIVLNEQIIMTPKKKYTAPAGFLNIKTIPINIGMSVSDIVNLLKLTGCKHLIRGSSKVKPGLPSFQIINLVNKEVITNPDITRKTKSIALLLSDKKSFH